jgi:nicotinamidase-related amidase
VEPAIEAASKAVDGARSNGDLIVKIGNEFPRRAVIRNLLRHHAAIAGSDGAALDQRIDPPEATYLTKWRSDEFCNPDLSVLLAEHQIGELLLAGLFAKACLSATAKGGRKRGLSVRVLGSATACSNEKTRRNALDKLHRGGIEVLE